MIAASDLEALREALEVPAPAPKPLPRCVVPRAEVSEALREIARMVAAVYRVEYGRLIGKRRTNHLAMARHVAMYLGRELTRGSFPEIGAFFSRDHATVIHAVRRIGAMRAASPVFAAAIDALARRAGEEGKSDGTDLTAAA